MTNHYSSCGLHSARIAVLSAHPFENPGPGFSVADHQAVALEAKRSALDRTGVSIADVAVDMMNHNTGGRIYRVGTPVRDVAIEHVKDNAEFLRGGLIFSLGPKPDGGVEGNSGWSSGTYVVKDKNGRVVDTGWYSSVSRKVAPPTQAPAKK
jgi:hypothetical protein